MSVIIRLQNLPWSANALDVRNFFKGLSIPDGGVHIVGGEMGDAFIAFSTDEDARQAMMLNGGKIKEVQVSLLLSSRAEMQKVIEDARRTTMSFMQLSAKQIQPPASIVPKVTAAAVPVNQQPQPPVISLSGFLAQNLNQQKAQSVYSDIPGLGFLATGNGMFQPNAPAAGLFSALSTQNYSNTATPSNAAFAQLSEQLKKVSDAEKSLSATSKPPSSLSINPNTSTKKDSGERSSRRSRSSSRERDRRRSRSRSRDRGSRRRGRNRSRDRRSRSRSRDRRDRRRRSRSRDRRDDRPRENSRDRELKVTDKSQKPRVSRFNDRAEPKAVAVADIVVIPTTTPPQPTTFVNPWDTPVQQNLMKLMNTGLGKPTQQITSASTMDSSQKSIAGDGFGSHSDQSQNLFPNSLESDVRMKVLPSINYGTFQSSKPLSNEQLSILQQLQTRRDPIVCQESNQSGIRHGGYFSDGDNKGFARNNPGIFDHLSRRDVSGDGYQTDGGMRKRNLSIEEKMDKTRKDDLDGQSVKISNLETVTGYGEVRRFFHGQTISSNGIKMINDQNGRRTGVALVRFLRRDGKRYALSRNGMRLKNSVLKIESITDQEFEDAIDSYRPGYDDAHSNWRDASVDKRGSRKDEVIEIRDDPKNQVGTFGTVVIWNLPTMTTELDLMKIFSDFSVVEVLIIKNYKNPKQMDGYVKFHRWEDARQACENINKHYIRNKRVFVKQCSEIEYDVAKNEYEAPQEITEQEPEPVSIVLDDSIQEVETISTKKNDADDGDKMDLADDEDDEGQLKIQLDETHLSNKMSTNITPESNFQLDNKEEWNDDPQQRQKNDGISLHQESLSSYQLGGDSWEPEQIQRPSPINRDPRNMFGQNFVHQQKQQHQSQNEHFQLHHSLPQLNLGFGGDINRDPRRRQDMTGQKLPGFDPNTFQSDNSRDSLSSHSQFNSQGPSSSSIENSRFGSQMSKMDGSNRYDQQQTGSFNNNLYDQQIDNNRGGTNGNNRFQYQSQMPNHTRNQFDAGRYDQRTNRNNSDGYEDKTTFIMISNLEYTMLESKIHDFFDHAGFNPKHIHLIRNQYGRSTGECLVEFGSPQEAGDTLTKNACSIGKRKAFIRHLNRSQIFDVMQRLNPRQNFQQGEPIGGNNSFNDNNSSTWNNRFDESNSKNMGRKGFFGNNGKGNNNNSFGGNNLSNNDEDRWSQENENQYLCQAISLDQDHYQEGNYQGNFDRQLDQEKQERHHDEQDVHSDNNEHEDPENQQQNNIGGDELNTAHLNEDIASNEVQLVEVDSNDSSKCSFGPGVVSDDPQLKQPITDDSETCEIIEIPDHGQPQQKIEQKQFDNHENDYLEHNDMVQQSESMSGNIVCLNNLPFRARNEELVNYFREYNITIQDVKRRYLPNGRPTGDAMVRFQNAVIAQRALQTHQNRRIGGRPIRMNILDN